MGTIILEESAVSIFALLLCKMEVTRFSETLESIYQTARHCITQENTLRSRGRDDLTSVFVCICRNTVREVWGEWGHRSYSDNWKLGRFWRLGFGGFGVHTYGEGIYLQWALRIGTKNAIINDKKSSVGKCFCSPSSQAPWRCFLRGVPFSPRYGEQVFFVNKRAGVHVHSARPI
jgi:hypothetical protein